MSPDNPYSEPNDLQPQIPRPSGSNNFMIVGIVLACVALPLVLCCGVALLLPAVQAAREAARRMQCSNNMKQIALALHNYDSVYGSFPPAYTVDANGQPLHSWRTLILPFIEQQALYDQIDLTKPWDDPVNLPLSEVDIPTYMCPSTILASGMTTYVVVVDPTGVFTGPQGSTISSITDGTSNTLLLTETDDSHAVNWMSPQDIDLAVFRDGSIPKSHVGGCNCSFCDGSVHFLSDNLDGASRDAIVSKDAGDAGSLGP